MQLVAVTMPASLLPPSDARPNKRPQRKQTQFDRRELYDRCHPDCACGAPHNTCPAKGLHKCDVCGDVLKRKCTKNKCKPDSAAPPGLANKQVQQIEALLRDQGHIRPTVATAPSHLNHVPAAPPPPLIVPIVHAVPDGKTEASPPAKRARQN